MANEVAELKVKISGDASELESTIKSVEQELKRLEAAEKKSGSSAAQQKKNTSAAAQNTKATKENADAKKENASASAESARNEEKSTEATQKNTSAKKENASASAESARNEEKSTEATQKNTSAVLQNQKAAQQNAERLKKLGKSWKEAGEAIDTFTKPFQYAAVGLAAGGVAAAKFAIDFEDSFAAVEKTVDGTPEQLEKVRQGIIDLTTVGIDGRSAIPMTTAQLNELAAAGGQLGIETDNIIEFTETMAQLGTATNLVGEEGAKTLARYMNVTQTSQDQVRNLGSAIVYLGNNYATTEAEIAEMAMRLGRTGTLVNMNAADVLGYSTALSSLGINAEAGGSAVSRTWTRLDNAAATGGEALELFAEVSGQTAEEFRQSWETDASEAFNSFIKGLEQAENLPLLLQALDINDIRESDALKALSLGYETMTKAVSDANAAWSENVALQKEFDTRAATTASQIQLMKNNLVEAARSIGETFLPDIVNATDGIKSFAQNIAQMSDAEKENLINTGKWIIGIGAASKVVSSGVKGVGNLLDAFGKMKGAFAEGGALAEYAPALTGIASAARPVTLAVAGIGVAAFAAKKGYDAWYDSQYRWTKGLSDGNDEIRESMEEMRELSNIQQEIRDQKLIIENPQSSQEQVETAKARIEEIKELLSEEYKLVIKSDNSNLEETVEQLQTINKNDVLAGINNQTKKLQNLQPKYDEYKENAAGLEQEAEAAINLQAAYSNAQLALQNYQFTAKEGESANDTMARIAKEQKELVEGYFKDVEGGIEDFERQLREGGPYGTVSSALRSGFNDAGADYEKAQERLENLTGSYQEFIAVATEISNWNTELLGKAALEGDAEEVERLLKSMGMYMQMVDELDASGYAQAAALEMNGLDSLETAWQQGGAALEGVVRDYIRASDEFGVSAQETAAGAALIKNGFRTAQEAADEGALDKVSKQATELARSLGAIPEDKKITISADGDISLVDETVEAVQQVENEDVKVSINADGNIDLLTEAGERVELLNGEAAYMTVNAEGNIEVFDQAGEKIAEIDGQTGTVNIVSGDISGLTAAEQAQQTVEKFGTVNGTINVTGTFEGQQEVGQALEDQDNLEDTSTSLTATGAYPGKEEIATALSHQHDLSDKSVTYTVNYQINGSWPFGDGPLARGTQDFAGGLARINDQRGIPDPRELVEVNGQQYLFEGRDVILPLPEHAKVYTASQTKQIMSMRGIRSYASGKNNEAWNAAQENWRHYTKVNNVSAEEELAHWQEMLKQFADDAEVIKEIQEEIVDSTKKMWDESLAAMEFNLDMGWISEEEYYSQLAAFRDENFAPNTEEWREATLELHKFNQETAKAQNEDSLAWIEHMGNTNDWDEIGDSMSAAYARVMDRNDQNLADGIITLEEYQDVANDTFTTLLDGYTNYSDNWIDRQKQYFGMSASEAVEATERQIAEVEALYASLENVTDEQYDAYITVHTQLENQLMDEQSSEADQYIDDVEWYRRQAGVYGWDFMNPGDSEIDTLKRAQDELWKKYEKAVSDETKDKILRQIDEYDMEIYQLQQESVDEFFSAASEAIDAAREKFNKEEEALRESWEVEDRAANKEEIQAQLDQYKYAVTKEGKDRYAELQEQMKEIEREEELYALQKKNNAVIEQMEADLAAAESEKKEIMEQVQAGTVNIQSLISQMNDAKHTSGVAGILQNILSKLDGMSVVKNISNNQNNYNYLSDQTTAIAFGNAAGRAFQYDSYGG